MKVTIITFADLGKKTNLKTQDILPVINKFIENNLLNQVICRLNYNFYFKKTNRAIPKIFHYIIKILERITFYSFSSRKIEEKLFDIIASYKIKKSDIVIFHGGYFLPKTFKKAKKTIPLLLIYL